MIAWKTTVEEQQSTHSTMLCRRGPDAAKFKIGVGGKRTDRKFIACGRAARRWRQDAVPPPGMLLPCLYRADRQRRGVAAQSRRHLDPPPSGKVCRGCQILLRIVCKRKGGSELALSGCGAERVCERTAEAEHIARRTMTGANPPRRDMKDVTRAEETFADSTKTRLFISSST